MKKTDDCRNVASGADGKRKVLKQIYLSEHYDLEDRILKYSLQIIKEYVFFFPFFNLHNLLYLIAGNPHDNAVMEIFWGRFKDTLQKHFRYRESDDLSSAIEQAIYYFNNERPARKLKGKPPVLYRTELMA